jgi:hypothetical protein
MKTFKVIPDRNYCTATVDAFAVARAAIAKGDQAC